MVKLFMEHKPNLNVQDFDKNSCVHLAAVGGYGEILKILFTGKPNLSLKNKKLRTAEEVSLKPEIKKLFQESGLY